MADVTWIPSSAATFYSVLCWTFRNTCCVYLRLLHLVDYLKYRQHPTFTFFHENPSYFSSYYYLRCAVYTTTGFPSHAPATQPAHYSQTTGMHGLYAFLHDILTLLYFSLLSVRLLLRVEHSNCILPVHVSEKAFCLAVGLAGVILLPFAFTYFCLAR